jgi:hypothetical protein
MILPPPANLISFPFILIFSCIRNANDKLVKGVNKYLTNFVFIPYALAYTLVFLFINIALIPWAYIVGLYSKCKDVIKVCCKKRDGNVVDALSHSATCGDTLLFLIFGLFMLILSQLTDVY